MQIQMIGHSTLLLESRGQKILTDPYFGTEGNKLYERLAPPALSRETLGVVQLVLLSHTHWDHVDPLYFDALPPTVPVVTPKYAAWFTRRERAKNVVGLSYWERRVCGEFTITAVPAIHDAIAAGFIIQAEGLYLYFSGDTYYTPFMKRIGRRWSLDVAFLPVTTTRIPMTMGPAAATQATQDLAPKIVIPVHLGLRSRFAFLRTHHTPEEFERRVRQAKLETRVILLKDGEVCSVS
jgi:L-ascorbate metabolism protein UlaG (beta-lactamase superfamily)